jgi:OOP family OmpA-OmpF porin
MNKFAKLALATAVAVCATNAMAEGWYGGIGAGKTKVQNWNSTSDVLDAMDVGASELGIDGFSGKISASTDDSDTGWKIFGGYQFHPNFAVEMAYMDLGEVTAKGRASGNFFCGGYCFTGSYDVNAKTEASALIFDGIAKTDLAPWMSVFGKLGVYQAKVEQKVKLSITDGIDSIGGSDSRDDSNTGLHFGVGADFPITQSVALRAEWERLSKVKSDESESDVDLLSVSAILKF